MKKEIGNSFWGIVDTAVYPLIYMAVVPLLMENLGVKGFGLWILINSLMVILQLFNLNIGITAIKELAGLDEPTAKKRLNALLSIVLIMFLLAGLTGLICGWLAENYNFSDLANAPVDSVFECFALAGIISGLKFLNQLYFGALKAKELIRQSALMNTFNKLGLLAVTVYLAVEGFDITALLYGNLLFSIFNLLLIFFLVSRYYQGYFPIISKDKKLMKKLFKFSVWPWLQSLLVVLAFQTDRFWVSAYAGLDEVANYGLISTLFNHIHMIYTAMFIWVLPRLTAMVSNDHNPFPFYRRISNIFNLFVVLGLLVFYVLSPYLFPLWIGNVHYQNMETYIQLFVVFELMFSHTIMPFFLMNATGKEKEFTFLTAFYCLFSYSLMLIVLLSTQSVEWMITAMAFSMFISMPILNYFTKKTQGPPKIGLFHNLKDMLPSYAAVGMVLLPLPWGLLFLIPIIVRLYRFMPMFYQFKRYGEVYSYK